MSDLSGKRVLLIVSGGIAAYKALELIRLLRTDGCGVTCVLTEAAGQFVTPLSLQSLSEDKVYSDLFSLTDESEMGHIQLSRAADLVVVAPATANILARMAAGIADDLATTLLLATDKPVLAAPAMNVRMWEHAATQANLRTLAGRGVAIVGPNEGPMACGEFGPGRLAEPPEILAAIRAFFAPKDRPLVRSPCARYQRADARAYRSGALHRQPLERPAGARDRRGRGCAGCARHAGERTRGAGDPAGVTVKHVETAQEMLDACLSALPADAAVCAAAVADWRTARSANAKIKKVPGAPPPALELTPNPDILATLSQSGPRRPRLVVGFAAETEDLIANAVAKRARKGCDWIVANDVSEEGVMGGSENTVHLVTETGVEDWPKLSKTEVARRLAGRIAKAFA